MLLVQYAIAKLMQKDVEIVWLHAEFAMESLMEKAPVKSSSMCNPRWGGGGSGEGC